MPEVDPVPATPALDAATPTPGEVARDELLECLIEFWTGQQESLRLAEQWSRYEEAIGNATKVAVDILEKAETESGGLAAARQALKGIAGISDDQRVQAMRKAMHQRSGDRLGAERRSGAALRRVLERRADLGLLSSQLVTLVADFELFVLRILNAWLAYDPSHLSERKREITFGELGEIGSVDEIREEMVRNFLESHMRLTAAKWFDVFCEMFGAKEIEGANDFVTAEAFQRRHIIVHHGGIVSHQYMTKMKGFKHEAKAGDHLPVTLEYVQRAADALAVVAHSVTGAALYASAKSPAEKKWVERETAELTFLLLNQDRENVVARFASKFNADRMKDEGSRELIRVNSWIAQRRLGNTELVIAQVTAWDVSAKDAKFKLARAVLMGDVDQAAEIARPLLANGDISILSIFRWPLFEQIRLPLIQKLQEAAHSDGERGTPNVG